LAIVGLKVAGFDAPSVANLVRMWLRALPRSPKAKNHSAGCARKRQINGDFRRFAPTLCGTTSASLARNWRHRSVRLFLSFESAKFRQADLSVLIERAVVLEMMSAYREITVHVFIEARVPCSSPRSAFVTFEQILTRHIPWFRQLSLSGESCYVRCYARWSSHSQLFWVKPWLWLL